MSSDASAGLTILLMGAVFGILLAVSDRDRGQRSGAALLIYATIFVTSLICASFQNYIAGIQILLAPFTPLPGAILGYVATRAASCWAGVK